MIIQDSQTDAYHLGRKSALSEVRDFQAQGLWTKELRTRLVRSAICQKRQMERKYPGMRGVITYYAGRIAALKSRLTANFSELEEREDDEIAHLWSRSFCESQERMREAVVYTHCSGWDWEEDMEDECDFIEREILLRASLSQARFRLDFADPWMCICIIGFILFPVALISCALSMLIFSALLAYIEEC
jgi:hypothetical protein